ncbi:TPA: ImmA/IrrE family metallo-endopeptidase [Shigella flexneri]|nr:ImmA/IrrE family metallo-endopeptidase [Shigella flexneri]
MTNPWRSLRNLAHVTLHWVHLPDDVLAETDGHKTIWMDPRQYQVQRRCSLMHELVHIERGDTDGCSDRGERDVEQEAARRLIPMTLLLDQLQWTGDFEELADGIGVDVPMLMARLDGLSEIERRMVVALWERRDAAC